MVNKNLTLRNENQSDFLFGHVPIGMLLLGLVMRGIEQAFVGQARVEPLYKYVLFMVAFC
jgi:hypothetical protein